jgi:hypothetical protein
VQHLVDYILYAADRTHLVPQGEQEIIQIEPLMPVHRISRETVVEGRIQRLISSSLTLAGLFMNSGSCAAEEHRERK